MLLFSFIIEIELVEDVIIESDFINTLCSKVISSQRYAQLSKLENMNKHETVHRCLYDLKIGVTLWLN